MEINTENFVEQMAEKIYGLHRYSQKPLTPESGKEAESNMATLHELAVTFGVAQEVVDEFQRMVEEDKWAKEYINS